MANYKPNAARSPSDLTERRKELIFADGYDVTEGATVMTATANKNEINLAVFGQDENITGTNITSASLSLTLLESDKGVVGFNRIIHNAKPVKDPTDGIYQYRAEDLDPVNVLILRKANDDTRIISSRFHPGVMFSPAYPEGAPDDKTVRAYTGNGGPAKEFDGLATCDLIESGGGTLRSTPWAIPRELSGTYAFWIEMVEPPTGGDNSAPGLKREPIRTPTPAMVSAAGVVDWPSLVSAVSSLSNPTYAQVYYLVSGVTGIPDNNTTIQPEGLRGAIT